MRHSLPIKAKHVAFDWRNVFVASEPDGSWDPNLPFLVEEHLSGWVERSWLFDVLELNDVTVGLDRSFGEGNIADRAERGVRLERRTRRLEEPINRYMMEL